MGGIHKVKEVYRKMLPMSARKVLGNIRNRTVLCMDHVMAVFGRTCIRDIVVSVGQACNFKCRDCGNFAPISPVEFRRYKVDDIISDLDTILKNVAKVSGIQIQGGNHSFIQT